MEMVSSEEFVKRMRPLAEAARAAGFPEEAVKILEDPDVFAEIFGVADQKVLESLNPEPMNKPVRQRPLPLVTRVVGKAGATGRLALAESIFELIVFARELLEDPLGRIAPLELELQTLKEMQGVVERFRKRRQRLEHAVVTALILKALADIYAEVAKAWPRARHCYKGFQPPGAHCSKPQNQEQVDALVTEDRKIKGLIAFFGDEIENPKKALKELTVCGVFIRDHGGPVKAAALRLGKVLKPPSRWIQGTLTLSKLAATRSMGWRRFQLLGPDQDRRIAEDVADFIWCLVMRISEARHEYTSLDLRARSSLKKPERVPPLR